MGKSLQQLAWAHAVHQATGGNVLILAPLAVSGQTVREGAKFGIPARYVRSQAEVQPGVSITNYERLEAFDLSAFAGVVLDESSILKAYSGKTKRALVEAASSVPFRLACTATPSPNDVLELGNHSEFLGVMTSGEMLTRWFINDQSQAGTYRLKAHGEADFWRWVASWAVCIAKPSDLPGEHSDEGFILPPLSIVERAVVVDQTIGADEGALFRMPSLNATGLHQELRRTAESRAAAVADLVNAEPGEAWVVWCNTNYEADALKAVLPEAVEVRGSDSAEAKEAQLEAFAAGETRVLITKPSVAGYGMNWQHCARMAFVGLSYSYEDFYQALRRSYRFGQAREVVAHVVMAETERGILATVARKQGEHEKMQRQMIEAMRGLSALGAHQGPGSVTAGAALTTTREGQGWTVFNGDCVEVTPQLEANSLHLSVFSPPFSNLYTYSPSLRDMGNTADDAEFMAHFAYLIPALLRATAPGRLAVVHTQDLVRYKTSTGASGFRDFPGEVIRAFEGAEGEDGARWVYHSRITIWKSPVTEMQRTKAHGLLYKTLKADASYSRQGRPDYLLVFRKWTAEADSLPVRHTPEDIPLDVWQQWASPVWYDIDQQDVLNAAIAREDRDEKHICPLQLDLIERAILLWTNPGEVVFDPFTGIGSTGFQALRTGRRFVGVELKPAYFEHACRNLTAAVEDSGAPLFDGLEEERAS